VNVFNLKEMHSHPYEERDKNVFYTAEEFKTRIIELPVGGAMPLCEMSSYVMYVIIEGSVEVQVNEHKAYLTEGNCLITEPALLSMKTETGVKMIGIQIVKNKV